MTSSSSQVNTLRCLTPDNFDDYGVETTDTKTASRVTLLDSQKLLTGSVLDVSSGVSHSPLVCKVLTRALNEALCRASFSQETLPLDR